MAGENGAVRNYEHSQGLSHYLSWCFFPQYCLLQHAKSKKYLPSKLAWASTHKSDLEDAKETVKTYIWNIIQDKGDRFIKIASCSQ